MRRTSVITGALALATALTVPAQSWAQPAQILIVNTDGPNEGFNDPTPVAPVGGNTGTTLGQQRLIAFQHAANLWAAELQSPVPIRVQASFNPLTCTATSAVLGAAGAIQIFGNSPGVEIQNIWYPVALANKLAGSDLAPGPEGTSADDIVAIFNSNLGAPSCLGGRPFYLGLDTNHGTAINLVTVLLHEFGHGLGFANFVTETNGTSPLNLGDVYSQYTLDTTVNKTWNQMTAAERAASAVRGRRVVWSGLNVTNAVPSVLSLGTPLFRVTSPSTLGVFQIGAAAFGPALSSPGVSGDVVLALDAADGAGPSTSDACSPITNSNAVFGRIALVDRGSCLFPVKVKNAQDAGAIAVLVADNVAGEPPAGLGGTDPTITIPSVRISLGDGNALKAALAQGVVTGTLGVDPTVRAGADTSNRAMLYMPNPVQSGSSGSHFDTSATRNLLMEPAINADLTHVVKPPVDLTLSLFQDIGWFSDGDGVPDGVDACLGSNRSATVVVGGIDSGVANTVFASGCRISDFVEYCEKSGGNHGGVVTCVGDLSLRLKSTGVITGREYGALTSAVARTRTAP
ncbi:serine protease [Luteitalea sp. TBR-22]|uniref:PA domain-containing protein n=1 Tax=Luteitalea sp. TBR-22 TaxID=2802971 RepID=UPI001AF3CAEC|nr:PA domain-containing protein [Luteitalea sp. TBR-22]BCS31912.1 serine protease [Luteitalea sp. TBR-22]